MTTPHPGIPEFDYQKPSSLMEASLFLQAHQGDSRIFCGGTDIFVRMRDGVWSAKYLVDIKHLDGMNLITFDETDGLTLGGAINLNQVIASPYVTQHYPLLAEASRTVASYQLRTRASLIGNICNASPAGDTLGACIAYRGELTVFGAQGFRKEPLATFFRGPGKTVLGPGDIVTAIHFPLPARGAKGIYIKLGRNNQGDLAIIGVTALVEPNDSSPSGYSFRLILSSVAPIPLEVTRASEILSVEPLSETRFDAAAQAAYDACHPIDDLRGTAQYRKIMARRLSKRALMKVWQDIQPGAHLLHKVEVG